MRRAVIAILFAWTCVACGSDSPLTTCPPGYMPAPFAMCTVNQAAPPCECYAQAPDCCAGDACWKHAVCDEGYWKCDTNWQVMDRHCALPDVPASD